MSNLLGPIGDRLREERVRLGFNKDQGGFAAKAGISENSLGAYERGQTAMKVPLLLILHDIGVDISYVLTGKRNDGSMGLMEQQHFDMLTKLSMREREAVFALVSTLAGATIGLDDLQAMSDRRGALHDKVRGFRGEND